MRYILINLGQQQQKENLPSMQEPQETWVQSLGREDSLEEEMASHSNILAWEIPWTEELDRLSPWGHKQLDTAHTYYTYVNLQVALVVKNLCSIPGWVRKIPQRRKWQPTPVFLPGESHRQTRLAGYSPQGHKESNKTEGTQHAACMHITCIILYINYMLTKKKISYRIVFIHSL